MVTDVWYRLTIDKHLKGDFRDYFTIQLFGL